MADQPENQGYTPASFEKRVAAWVGIVYMLMLTALITYTMSTARSLPGTAPLLLIPMGVGVGIVVVHRQRQGTAPGGLVISVLMFLLCLAAVMLGAGLGIPALLNNLSTPV